MAMFNDIVSFPGGEMARGKNYYRTLASLLNFASQTCRCLQSPIFVYFCLYNQILTSH